MKVAIFYHCLLFRGDPPEFLPNAAAIVYEQMDHLRSTGLLERCDEMIVGCNGGNESVAVARQIIPPKARLVMHGLQSKAENLTIVEIEKWAPSHPGWAILYFHSKAATHQPGDDYHKFSSKWRREMMADLVGNWKDCVAALKAGNDIVCSHFMWGMGSDRSQHIPAGNFLWVTSDFAAKLPSMYHRDRIKQSGIAGAESRFESEVYWGNGPRPKVHQWRPNGGGGVP